VLDVSGGAIEWNIKPGQNSSGALTTCDEKVCITRDSWVVGEQKGFGNGICSGTMLWSYTHQHVGAINGSISINGKPYCTSLPIHGTDPSNPPGNEKGYVVKFTSCIDKDKLGNELRLNKGDVVEAVSYYDVDKTSTATLPLPGGKHGGIMALFFAMMDCDPGTFGEIYVCRQATCVPTFKGNLGLAAKSYKTRSACEAACPPGCVTTPAPRPRPCCSPPSPPSQSQTFPSYQYPAEQAGVRRAESTAPTGKRAHQ